jgi:hypothetical protein
MKWQLWLFIGTVNFALLASGGLLQLGAVVLFAIVILIMACTKH